jgi:hypothetical protein
MRAIPSEANTVQADSCSADAGTLSRVHPAQIYDVGTVVLDCIGMHAASVCLELVGARAAVLPALLGISEVRVIHLQLPGGKDGMRA